MRTLLLVTWLLLPLGFLAFHYGPGQQHLSQDQAALILASADRAAQAKKFVDAQALYEMALAALPPSDRLRQQQVRLELCKTQMMNRQLPEANANLAALVEELAADRSADPQLFAEARGTLANSQYYLTWLMRLEGQPRDKWEAEIDRAQQLYRQLAVESKSNQDSTQLQRWQQDLEASVKLARMDLGELQGLPLPSQ